MKLFCEYFKGKLTKYKKIIAELTLSQWISCQWIIIFSFCQTSRHKTIPEISLTDLRKCQNRINNMPILNTEANGWLTWQAKNFFSNAHDKTIVKRQLWAVTKWHSTNPNFRIKQLLITKYLMIIIYIFFFNSDNSYGKVRKMQILLNIFCYFTQQIHMCNDGCHCESLLVHDILQKALVLYKYVFILFTPLCIYS